ncbi:unnamed protein product, partial [Notodromas monacha]
MELKARTVPMTVMSDDDQHSDKISFKDKCKLCFWQNYKTWIIVLTPVLLSPLLFHPTSDK